MERELPQYILLHYRDKILHQVHHAIQGYLLGGKALLVPVQHVNLFV